MLKKLETDPLTDKDPALIEEWLDSLDFVLHKHGAEAVRQLLIQMQERAYRQGVTMPFSANTPYVNTIPPEQQPRFPGDREIERRIKSIVRWNAMCMVVRAAKEGFGVGGHIATFASSATLYEIGFNHFFKGRGAEGGGDFIYFQGHASPGIYSRAFLEGRLTEQDLANFRRELKPEGGLSSYPHPWLMPDFWEFPTVSMGLGPLMAIYHARFLRYMEDRSIKDTSKQHVWAFLGDGECDEPETLGAINLATRENLDNLIFVINCNLQRLDGPVRGNGKIIQELEAVFRGAGWNVIKVVWGSDWDPLIASDRDGDLVKRMGETVDGQYQKYTVEPGSYIRDHFFGATPELRERVEHLSDEQLRKLKRGGHDPEKVFAAYQAAIDHVGSPTVILAKTVKGYGLGDAGEGRNKTHQQKKLEEEEVREFRSRFGIPIADDGIGKMPFYKPPADSPEMKYLQQRRVELGGPLPIRSKHSEPLNVPPLGEFADILKTTGDRENSTTMAFNRTLGVLLKNKELSKLIVPIIPDEARTFGMEGLFRQIGIYSSLGQLYEPVDAGKEFAFYREAKNGQLLEEGINEAGSLCSFIAAGTAYANHGINMIPFFIYYSMFGFQRVGDLIWAAADSRCRGFLLGATAGRTTLNGEGLQHEDGHSHLLATTVPNCVAYDPSFAYEVAVIVQDGLKRMYRDQESIFYYITLYNEDYIHPAMPEGSAEGILKGLYKVAPSKLEKSKIALRPQLFGSGPMLLQALTAQKTLEEKYGVAADVWSATSYKELRREALAVERWNKLHPNSQPRVSYLEKTLAGIKGPFISVSDNMRLVAEQIGRWVPGRYNVLGTDGFGRSESRQALRRHFEIDAEHVTYAALHALTQEKAFDASALEKAIKDLGIDSEQVDPVTA